MIQESYFVVVVVVVVFFLREVQPQFRSCIAVALPVITFQR